MPNGTQRKSYVFMVSAGLIAGLFLTQAATVTASVNTAVTLINSAEVADPPAATYSFTILDVPGSTNTFAGSINDSGQVAGWYGDGSGVHGFVYSNGAFTTFDPPGAIYTFPASINASGQVTGDYSDSSGVHGFVYSNGTFTTLDVPGATNTFPASINASGQVTGSFGSGMTVPHGFVYSNGTFTTLDVPGATNTFPASINASGQVTGDYSDSSGVHGFVYGNGMFTTIDVPGATNTSATSINASGQVTGSFGSGMTVPHGFVYSNGTFTTLDVPGATNTSATSINASGQVTGSSFGSGMTGPHGFVYSNGTFTTLDVPGAILTSATDINDSGQVVGHYSSPQQFFVYSNGTFTTLDVPGTANAQTIIGINASGQVTGSYWDSFGRFHGFIATPAPATVTVSKTLSGAAAGSVPAGTSFPITLACGSTVLSLNATTTTPAVFTNAPVGSCTVAEGALPTIAGVTWGTPTYDPSATVTVMAGANAAVTVTNTADITTHAITATASPAAGGTASCAPNPVNHGATATCTATANAGYAFADWSGDCTGSGACTLSNVTATKAVTANFTVTANKTFTGPTATGTGDATATVSGGGDTCGFTRSQFVALTSVPVAPPAGYSFPQGLFDFALANCAPGGTVTLTIAYPTALPAGTVYWKYGPTPGNPSPTWYQMPATLAGNTATFSITDGGLGDDDLTADGAIVDQGGPGAPGTADIPTLSEWAMLLLMGLLLGYGGWRLRRKESF